MNNKGFTTPEVLVTLTIMSIIFISIFSSYRFLSKEKYEARIDTELIYYTLYKSESSLDIDEDIVEFQDDILHKSIVTNNDGFKYIETEVTYEDKIFKIKRYKADRGDELW